MQFKLIKALQNNCIHFKTCTIAKIKLHQGIIIYSSLGTFSFEI